MITRQFSSAKRLAVAWPIPRLAPVTSTRFRSAAISRPRWSRAGIHGVHAEAPLRQCRPVGGVLHGAVEPGESRLAPQVPRRYLQALTGLEGVDVDVGPPRADQETRALPLAA